MVNQVHGTAGRLPCIQGAGASGEVRRPAAASAGPVGNGFRLSTETGTCILAKGPMAHFSSTDLSRSPFNKHFSQPPLPCALAQRRSCWG